MKISEKQLKVLRLDVKMNDVLIGTPRSGKSWCLYQRLTDIINNKLTVDDNSILVLAYSQETANRLLIDGDGEGLEHIYKGVAKVKNDKKFGQIMDIPTPTGNKRLYIKGGGKASDYKAFRGMSFSVVIFCEFNLLHPNSIIEAFERTKAARTRYHLADMNPTVNTHPIYDIIKRFNFREHHFLIHDNPIMTPERAIEIFNELKHDKNLVDQLFLGKAGKPEGSVYTFKASELPFELRKDRISYIYYTIDGGQRDATSATCNIVLKSPEGEYVLYRYKTYYYRYKSGEDNKPFSKMAEEIKEFIDDIEQELSLPYDVYADPACLSLRAELEDNGLKVRLMENNATEGRKSGGGAGSGVEIGIAKVKSLHAENLLYFSTQSMKYFNTEQIEYVRLNDGKPRDKFNDYMDELRGAVNTYYTEYK